jgi:hypothetical protein
MPMVANFERVDVIEGSENLVVPGGVQVVSIWVVGAGGSGSTGNFPAGGGAGGVAYREYPVQEGDWGTTLTVVIGAAAVDADGTATTVDGTLNGGTITTLSGGGGGKATSLGAGGAGGTASGGTTNVPGLDGQEYDSENDIAGLGAVISDPGVEAYISNEVYGWGGDGDAGQQFAGGPGVAIFWWRN